MYFFFFSLFKKALFQGPAGLPGKPGQPGDVGVQVSFSFLFFPFNFFISLFSMYLKLICKF